MMDDGRHSVEHQGTRIMMDGISTSDHARQSRSLRRTTSFSAFLNLGMVSTRANCVAIRHFCITAAASYATRLTRSE